MTSTTAAKWQYTAVALHDTYRNGTTTPSAVLADCLARIDEVNPQINALIAMRRESSIAEAARSSERFSRGEPLSPLDGIPLVVKDNINSADLPTTWGSVAGSDQRAPQDELALARARAGGAVFIGKSNAPEFTLEGYTANALFGVTRNPWNPRLTPGGSSGGSVAAVAAGMAPLALGTDGGGSTRRPASHTGLVGFKPSIGAIAREHALPPLLLDFEVIGPIARTVADVRLLFDCLRGPHPGDRRSLAAAAARPLPDQMKVLYVPSLDDAPVDPQIAASCREAADRLAGQGHAVEEGPLPLDLSGIAPQWPMLGQVGLAWLFERHPRWRSGAAPKFLDMAATGLQVPAKDLWQYLESVEQLRRDVAALFSRIDLIVTPAAAALPWPAQEPFPPEIDGRPVGPRGHAIFTGWVNAAGLPAIAMPCRPSADRLPIGVQLIGEYGSDSALLTVAEQFEQAAPEPWQWPPCR